MSTSASSPSNDSSSLLLFGLDVRLVPVIAALISFFVFAAIVLCAVCLCHMQRQARLLRDPLYQAALRERERLRAEREKALNCPPTFDTAYLTSHTEKGLDSKNLERYLPLSVEEQKQNSPKENARKPSIGIACVAFTIALPRPPSEDEPPEIVLGGLEIKYRQ